MSPDRLADLQIPQAQPLGVSVTQVLRHADDLERAALYASSAEGANTLREAAAVARRDAADMLRRVPDASGQLMARIIDRAAAQRAED